MPERKIPALFVAFVLMIPFGSCLRKQENLIDLVLIRIDPVEILLSDSINALIDNRSHDFRTDIRVDTVREGVYHVLFTITTNKPKQSLVIFT